MFIRVKTQAGDFLLKRAAIIRVSVGVNAVFFDLDGPDADSSEQVRVMKGKTADALTYIHTFLNDDEQAGRTEMDLTPFQKEGA